MTNSMYSCFLTTHTHTHTQVYEVVQTVKGDYPSIRFGTGKCVFELRPDITWDKGKAMVWLLQALGLREKDDVFTIYIGDDMTDEDAFQVGLVISGRPLLLLSCHVQYAHHPPPSSSHPHRFFGNKSIWV